MTDDESRVVEGELMPPSQSASSLTTADFGRTRTALMSRIEAWGARKVIDGWTRVIAAEAFYYNSIESRNEAMSRASESIALLDENDAVVAAAKRKIRAEIQKMDLQNELEVERLQNEISEAKFERERKEHEQAMDRIKWDLQRNPQSKDEGPKRSKLGKELDEIRGRGQYIKELEELLQHLLKEAGVEDEEDLDDISKGILRSAREAVELGVE